MECICGSDKTIEKHAGPHLGVYCAGCDKWLYWAKQDKPISKDWKTYKIMFGKHCGKTLNEVPLSYVKWICENLDEKDEIHKLAVIALENRGGKKLREKSAPVTEQCVYNIIDVKTETRLSFCKMKDLKEEVLNFWPNFVMMHPAFISVDKEIVGRIEYSHTEQRTKPKAEIIEPEEDQLF